MADPQAPSFGDFITAGTSVKQDVGTNAGADLTAGANLAIGYQKHQQDMQDFQNKQSQFKEQQGQWANEQLGSIMAIQNPNMRALKWKQFAKTAAVAGVSVDPDAAMLVKDDDFARKFQQGITQINGLPYNERTAALLDHMNMIGDSATLEKTIQGAGQTMASRYATTTNANINNAQVQREMDFKREETTRNARKEVTEANKEPIGLLTNVNAIIDTAQDPTLRNSPSANEQVKQLLSKVTNPGGVIRESEINEWKNANPGVFERLKGIKKNLSGEGQLTENQWADIAWLAQRAGDRTQAYVNQQKQATAQDLAPLGIDAEHVYSTIPKYTSPDLSKTFPKQFGGGGQPPAAGATTGQVPGGMVSPGASAIRTFAGLSPEKQQGLQALAKNYGITLDPASKDFAQAYVQLQQKLLSLKKPQQGAQ